MLTDEVWVKAAAYPMYEVSSVGNVRRISIFGRDVSRPVKTHPRKYPGSYLVVALCANNRPRAIAVHRLVYESFVGPLPIGVQINHRDGDKTNNSLINLEAVTAAENMAHARQMGLMARGERQGRAKLSDEQVLEARAMHALGSVSFKELGHRYGVSDTAMRHAVQGKTWTHI